MTSTFVLRGRRGAYGTGLAPLGRAPVTPRHFAWQARHLATSTFVLRGRRGTWRHLPSFGVALMAGWLWWHAWARLVAGDAAALCVALGGRCGTWRHLPSFCVAGVALMALGWLWWRAWVRLVAGDAAAFLFGRRCTWRHPPSFHVAGVALEDIYLRFAWQAWRLWHWAGSGGALGRAWSPVTPRHFAWQAWHLATSTFVSHGAPLCHTPSFTHHL